LTLVPLKVDDAGCRLVWTSCGYFCVSMFLISKYSWFLGSGWCFFF